MIVMTPTNARKEFYSLIKDVVKDSVPVEVTSTKDEQESVVIVSKSDWKSINETLFLHNVGVLDTIKAHEDEEVESLGVINWDTM